ncbi:MAG: hypothetical protein ACP5RX_00125 [Minisyncoccia bacterium]
MKENKKTNEVTNQVVLVRKGVTRGYRRTETGKIKITPTPKQGQLDAKTRRVFRELAEMLLLGLGGDD